MAQTAKKGAYGRVPNRPKKHAPKSEWTEWRQRVFRRSVGMAAALRYARIDFGVTQKQLAMELGVDKSTVGNREAGTAVTVDFSTLKAHHDAARGSAPAALSMTDERLREIARSVLQMDPAFDEADMTLLRAVAREARAGARAGAFEEAMALLDNTTIGDAPYLSLRELLRQRAAEARKP